MYQSVLNLSGSRGHILKENQVSFPEKPLILLSLALVHQCGNLSMSRKQCITPVLSHLRLLYSVFLPLLQWFLSFKERGCDTDVLLCLSTPMTPASTFWLVVSFCISQFHLNKETPLMRSESYSNLWLRSEFRGKFETCPFSRIMVRGLFLSLWSLKQWVLA